MSKDIKIDHEGYLNFQSDQYHASDEPYLRGQDMVIARAEMGYKDAIEVLDELRSLQLRSETAENKEEKVLLEMEAREIWEKALKNNPPSGNDGFAIDISNLGKFLRARGIK